MLSIRDARPDDLPAIFEIYHEQVLHGTATFDTEPKSVEAQARWFEAHPRERYPILIAEDSGGAGGAGGAIAGWARLYPWSDRLAYRRSAENSVYVHRDRRGQGVGRALLAALLERARDVEICVVLARIAEGNPASIALHRSLGFTPVGTLRRVGEKFGRLLDVDILQLHLDGFGPPAPDQPSPGGRPPTA